MNIKIVTKRTIDILAVAALLTIVTSITLGNLTLFERGLDMFWALIATIVFLAILRELR